MWLLVSWRPQWSGRASTPRAAEMRTYWLGVLGARITSWIGDQSDRVTVGALGGASIAGLYDSAKRWAWFAFFELFIPLTDVAVATLSRVRNDAERFRTYVRQALLPIVAVTMPVAAFMFVEARLVLRVILGDQWLGAAPFVRWLCIALVGATVIRLMWWVYLATGRTMRQLRWSLVTTPVTLAAVLVGGLGYGAVGVAAGLAVATFLLAIPSILNAVHDTPVTLGDCLGVIALPLAAAAIGAGILMFLDTRLPAAPPVVALALRLAVFAALYTLGWFTLPGGRHALVGLFARLGEVISTWRGVLGRRTTI
jgi:PST family polysaccharide transporter